MRKKLFNILNKIYGILMTASFFGGLLPLIPFIFSLIVGGTLAENISVFLYDKYYPWVIIVGSIAIVAGLIAMYLGKLEALSIKSVSAENNTDNSESNEEASKNK